MKTRTLIILAGATAVVVAAAVVAVTGRESAVKRTTVEAKLFPGLIDRINDVRVIEVVPGDGTFRVTGEGETWTVPAKADFPARFDKVKEALIDVADLNTVEAKTDDAERLSALGLADPGSDKGAGMIVRLLGADDKPIAALVMGEAARQRGQDHYYVRREGENQSWLARGKLDIGKAPKDWIDSLLFKVPDDEVRRVVIRHDDGQTVELSRDTRDDKAFLLANMPEGAELTSPLTLDNLGRALSVMRFEDVTGVGSAPISGDPVAVTEFDTFGGRTYTVSLWRDTGAKPDDKGVLPPPVWARFQVAYDPAAAVAPAPDADKADKADAASDTDGDKAEAKADPAAEVAAIVARTKDWTFKLADYKAEQLSLRMDKLIKMPEPATGDAGAAPTGQAPDGAGGAAPEMPAANQ